MSFTLNGVTYTPKTATEYAQDALSNMNTALIAQGLSPLSATQSNALWWTLLAQGTDKVEYVNALYQASQSLNIALCDDDQVLNLLPIAGTSLIPAAYSTVTLTIVATSAGATIPINSTLTAGVYTFETTQAITIPASGTATVGAQCTVTGPITVASGVITAFSPTIAGVSTVTNTTAVPGRDVETAAQARTRLLAGGANVTGLLGAITAIQALPGITQATVLFNYGSPGGLTLTGYSTSLAYRNAIIFVVGNSSDIASTYYQYMNAATQAGSVSNQTSTFYTSVGQAMTVNYEQAVAQDVYVNVQYVASTNVPVNIETLVENVIMALNGTFQIGAKITTIPLYQAFNGFSAAQILGINLSLTSTGGPYSQTVTMNANAYPVFTADNISVTAVS